MVEGGRIVPHFEILLANVLLTEIDISSKTITSNLQQATDHYRICHSMRLPPSHMHMHPRMAKPIRINELIRPIA